LLIDRLVCRLLTESGLAAFSGQRILPMPNGAAARGRNRYEGVKHFITGVVLRRIVRFPHGLSSRHVSADGTSVRVNASFKSFMQSEVALDPRKYKKRLRVADEEETPPQDPGSPSVGFRGEK
jgi:hypothetical protein